MLKSIEKFQNMDGNFYFTPSAFFTLLSDIQNEVDDEYVLKSTSSKPTKATLEDNANKLTELIRRLYDSCTTVNTFDENSHKVVKSLIIQEDSLLNFRDEFNELGIEVPNLFDENSMLEIDALSETEDIDVISDDEK